MHYNIQTVFVCLIVLGRATHIRGWDPHAGLIPSIILNNQVNVTSNPSSASMVTDGDPETVWQSGSCLPTGFIERADLNVLLGLCAEGDCNANGNSDGLELATDGTFYGGPVVAVVDGVALFEVNFHAHSNSLRRLHLRAKYDAETKLYLYDDIEKIELATMTPDDSYTDIIIKKHFTSVSKLSVESVEPFQVYEVAALTPDPCYEMAIVHVEQQNVGVIRTRHWAGGSAFATELLIHNSENGWFVLMNLDPDNLSEQFIRLDEEASIDYIAVKHYVEDGDYKKVYVWEISAWDQYGTWGRAPEAVPNPVSLHDLLGVNGIWCWQTGSYSDLLPPTLGPDLYNDVTSHARNYHNMNWDVHDPTSIPDYDAMANGEGTEVHWWLDWDREYGAWDESFNISFASIQFLNKPGDMPVEEWVDPYQNAYNYGYAFADHFGSGRGTGHLYAMEIGNEPWDYPVGFYPEVLHGMAQGAVDAQSDIQIFPCALQADDINSPTNYIGLNLNETAAPLLDGINLHIYSFLHTNDGKRIGVHPEHPESSFNAVRNMIRWRNANMPRKHIWVTEWGWDSDGVNENCANTECVSEEAQALYGVRGLSILARLGIPKATWFFFANNENCNTLFCRSGLTSSANNNFSKKRVFQAFESLLHLSGQSSFMGIIKEDKDAFVYRLGNNGIDTHLIMWRPVDANVGDAVQISFAYSGLPLSSYQISGITGEGDSIANPTVIDNLWLADITAVPVITSLV